MRKNIFWALLVVLVLVVPCGAETGFYKPEPTFYVPVYVDATVKAPAQASPPLSAPEPVWYEAGPYVLLQGGVYGPSNGNSDLYSEYEANPGFTADLVLGYKLNPMWSLQMDIGYQTTAGLAGFGYWAMPITGAVRLGLPVGPFEPYILGGFGAYFIKTTANAGAEPYDEVRMGGYFGAGILYHFANKMMLGGEVRYQMLDFVNGPNDGMLLFVGLGYQY